MVLKLATFFYLIRIYGPKIGYTFLFNQNLWSEKKGSALLSTKSLHSCLIIWSQIKRLVKKEGKVAAGPLDQPVGPGKLKA